MGVLAKTPVGQFKRWWLAFGIIWWTTAAVWVLYDDKQGILDFTPNDWAKVTLAAAGIVYMDAQL